MNKSRKRTSAKYANREVPARFDALAGVRNIFILLGHLRAMSGKELRVYVWLLLSAEWFGNLGMLTERDSVAAGGIGFSVEEFRAVLAALCEAGYVRVTRIPEGYSSCTLVVPSQPKIEPTDADLARIDALIDSAYGPGVGA